LSLLVVALVSSLTAIVHAQWYILVSSQAVLVLVSRGAGLVPDSACPSLVVALVLSKAVFVSLDRGAGLVPVSICSSLVVALVPPGRGAGLVPGGTCSNLAGALVSSRLRQCSSLSNVALI